MAEFVMPSLGADMGEGKLVAWRKKAGDTVRRGEIIAEVETDKAAVDVECHLDGVIEKFLVEPGQKVPVGTPLAVIRTGKEGETPAPAVAAPAAVPVMKPAEIPAAPKPPPVFKAPAPIVPPAIPAGTEGGRLRISPYAARLALELSVDVKGLAGTGYQGAISADDVLRAAEVKKLPAAAAPSGTAGAEADSPQVRMRRAIAASMGRSKREIPHYYLIHTINLEKSLAWLAEANTKLPVEQRLIPAVLLLKATALALREVPELNALWENGRAVTKADIHVGAAIALRGGGLIAPALHHTDKADLGDLMQRFRDLVKRGRAGKLKSSEMTDPTITVTSLGDQGVDGLIGVIYPPQVAIVGFGTPAERPWVVDGKVVPQRMILATLSGDHRVTDGHRGSQLLAAIERLLQEPEKLK